MTQYIVSDGDYLILVTGILAGICLSLITNIWVATKFKLVELYPWSKHYETYRHWNKIMFRIIIGLLLFFVASLGIVLFT